MKKICCYIWDPVYDDGLNPDSDQRTEDGMSVGNPEAIISQMPIEEILIQSSVSSESSTETDSSEDEIETTTFKSVVKNLLSAEQKNVLRHRAGTIKRITQKNDNDQVNISPFAVCGGYRVGSLRQLFHDEKENKKKTVTFSAETKKKADPALKVRNFLTNTLISRPEKSATDFFIL